VVVAEQRVVVPGPVVVVVAGSALFLERASAAALVTWLVRITMTRRVQTVKAKQDNRLCQEQLGMPQGIA
jgi:hypothetical protein